MIKRKHFLGLIERKVLNKTERKKVVKDEKSEEYLKNCKVEDLVEILITLAKTNTVLSKFRIFEGKLRVRDFSFINCRLTYRKDGSIEFKFAFKGDYDNQVYFKDDCDIRLDPTNGHVLIYVHGPVYFFDNSRRYEGVVKNP